MRTQYLIYVLKHPQEPKIRYIGITKQALKARLGAHLSAAHRTHKSKRPLLCWLRSLQRYDLKPEIELLQTIWGMRIQALHFEAAWIYYYEQEGYSLLNVMKHSLYFDPQNRPIELVLSPENTSSANTLYVGKPKEIK